MERAICSCGSQFIGDNIPDYHHDTSKDGASNHEFTVLITLSDDVEAWSYPVNK